MYVTITTVIIILLYYLLTKYFDKSNKIDGRLANFIENAHEAYIKAHEIEDTTPFQKYAAVDVVVELRDKIEYGEEELYGIKRYRERKVSLISENKDIVKVRIAICHQHIKINRNMAVAIGDDISSIWKIKTTNNKFKVIDII